MGKIILSVLSVLCFLAAVPDLQAPEVTERDILGYDSYRIAADGAIFDRDGAIRGWLQGDIVYDTMWNEKYLIREKKLYSVNGGPEG
jgi:hypothetical protein